MAKQLSFTTIIENSAKMPLVRIDRKEFLTKNLGKLCTKSQLQKAIIEGTLHANIPISTLDSLANAVIKAETIRVTTISAAAGLPGGFAMAATIPADLVQYYGFVIRIAQELAYIYGWNEMFAKSTELDASTESQLILFIGVMSGVGAANIAVAKLFGEVAMRSVAKKVAAKALTKTWYYPIAKKIASFLGQKMVKATFAKGVSKAVPILGGAISGGLTFATFKPMTHKLKKHLSTMAHMSPKEFAEYESAIDMDMEEININGEGAELVIENIDLKYWMCTCETQNKGKFCTTCGKAKLSGIPQYKCDKCDWEPDDNTQPPNFCQECGDPFDDGDIVLV